VNATRSAPSAIDIYSAGQ